MKDITVFLLTLSRLQTVVLAGRIVYLTRMRYLLKIQCTTNTLQ